MRVYKDVFTGDELCSDSYSELHPFDDAKLSDVAFEVKSSRVTKGAEDYGIAHNTEADDESGATAAGGDESAETVNDIVDSFKLTETYFTKRDFQVYIRNYMTRVRVRLQEKKPDRVDKFSEGARDIVNRILAEFDDFKFYMGESLDAEAGLVYSRYVGEEPSPRFLYFRDGLEEVKY